MPDSANSALEKQDRLAIAQAPLLVFLLVSAADGTIDEKEIARFQALLISEPYRELLERMEQAQVVIGDSLQSLAATEVDYLAELERIDLALQRHASEGDARRIKRLLVELGESIAASSGGVSDGDEGSIGPEERTALKVIAGILGVNGTG